MHIDLTLQDTTTLIALRIEFQLNARKMGMSAPVITSLEDLFLWDGYDGQDRVC